MGQIAKTNLVLYYLIVWASHKIWCKLNQSWKNLLQTLQRNMKNNLFGNFISAWDLFMFRMINRFVPNTPFLYPLK